MRVFVTGGSGYVGKVVIDRLLEAGHQVTALQRAHSPRGVEQPGVTVVVGDILDVGSFQLGMQQHDAVVQLVGIIKEYPRKGMTMKRVHVDGTKNVLAAAKNNGIHRFLHMSALNTREGAVSNYHRSKWEAEECVRQSGMSYTIFRPSVIFGKGGTGPEFVGQLVNLVKRAPLVPIVGDGHFLLQPVSVQTVGEAFAQSLTAEVTFNREYEVGGPTVLSYLDILRHIAKSLHKPLRTIRMPVSFMQRLVPILQKTPGFPLTVDQLTMLLEGNVCQYAEPLYSDLQLEKIPFEVTI
jgi:uncharacterized protein YbjT (DUF2867 family)